MRNNLLSGLGSRGLDPTLKENGITTGLGILLSKGYSKATVTTGLLGDITNHLSSASQTKSAIPEPYLPCIGGRLCSRVLLGVGIHFSCRNVQRCKLGSNYGNIPKGPRTQIIGF